MHYLIYAPETPDERTYNLKAGVNSVGREHDNSIVLMHGSISRHHAEITINNDEIILRDRNSKNKTYVNEVEIEKQSLKDGDIVRFGRVVLKFVGDPESTSTLTDVEQEESNLTVLKKLSPEKTRTAMEELLDIQGTQKSVLKLREDDSDRRAVDKLKILLELSKQLSSPEDPEQLLEKILNLLFEIMNVDRAAILLTEEERGTVEVKTLRSRTGMTPSSQFYSKQIVNLVYKTGDAILTGDAVIDPQFEDSKSIIAQSIRASMCAPLKPREETIGVLYVDNLSRSNVYTEEDLEFLTCIANQAAIAIENSKLYQKIQAAAILRDKLERFFPPAVSQKIKETAELKIVDTEVTALFADISDYTKLSSKMEPRQIIEMLNEYFTVMVEEIVFPYEGTLEKYIGDALLAVWGAPYQKPDDADRAVRAAIEMQLAVCRFNHSWVRGQNEPIAIHIGLNTGKVAAGNIGSKNLIQYAMIGDTTNVASRICNVANAGEIVISQSTRDRLKDPYLPLEDIGTKMVKGKEKPLQLYRVVWDQLQSILTLPPVIE